MKKDSITIPYDEEKLAALRLYLEHKGQSVEQEMISAVDVLYAKAVFLDLRSGMELKTAERRKRPQPAAEPEPSPTSLPESSNSF